MAESATALLKRRDALRSQAAQAFWIGQEIAQYIAPHRSNITIEREPGAEKTEFVFDSTAMDAKITLDMSLHGTLTPSTQPWVSLKMRDDDLNDEAEIAEWLEDDSTKIHKAYRESNFNESVHEMFGDLTGSGGMGALFIDEKEPTADGGFGGFRFTTMPFGKYVVAENADGVVDTIFYDFKLSARAAVQKWGDKVGKKILDTAATKPDQVFEFCHAIYPRKGRAYGRDGQPKAGSKNLPWASCYLAITEKKIVDEGGYEEFPCAVPRWNKVTGEVMGFGPSHVALPSVKTLNTARMLWLQAAPLNMQPPTIERDDSILGEIDLTPGGRNVVNGSGPLADNLAFLQPQGRLDWSQMIFAEERQFIRQIYFSDHLRLQEGPQMTATEVQVRYELMQRLLGPTLGRLESEFLNPLVKRSFAIMARARAFKPLPAALEQAVREQSSAANLDVEYEGPLARAQRTIEITAQDRVTAFVVEAAAKILPISPQTAQAMLDVLNFDQMIRDRAEITGLSSDSLHTPEDVAAKRQQRQQQMQQQQQMAGMAQAAEMAKNVSPMLQAMKPPEQTGKAA